MKQKQRVPLSFICIEFVMSLMICFLKYDSVKNGEKNSFKDFVTLKPLMNSRILCETFQNV